MKKIIVALSLFVSVNGLAWTNTYNTNLGTVIKTPQGSFFVPKTPEKQLSGDGVVFNSYLKITEQKEQAVDENTGKPVEKVKKTYQAWIRNCGNVDLPDNSQQSKAHNGDRIELRFRQSGSCEVMDWKLN